MQIFLGILIPFLGTTLGSARKESWTPQMREMARERSKNG